MVQTSDIYQAFLKKSWKIVSEKSLGQILWKKIYNKKKETVRKQ